MQAPADGICVVCERPGASGARCSTPACDRRGYHCIPSSCHRPGAAGPGDVLIGQMWGNYLLVERLGAGGVGVVYGAVQPPIMLPAAVKIISTEAPAPLVERFRGEAVALARLNHPNIVRMLHFGQHQGSPFLVMERVPGGRTLRGVDRSALGTSAIFSILAQLCDALEAAHLVGVVHRDIKPGNIMLQALPQDPWFVRLVDFGLAKFTETGHSTGLLAGTPNYMAPEQLTRQAVGPWTDWYAFGVIAFELLVGSRPYLAESTGELVRYKMMSDYRPTDEPHLSHLAPAMRAMFESLLAHDPARRARSGEAVRPLLAAAAAAVDETETLDDAIGDTLVDGRMRFVGESSVRLPASSAASDAGPRRTMRLAAPSARSLGGDPISAEAVVPAVVSAVVPAVASVRVPVVGPRVASGNEPSASAAGNVTRTAPDRRAGALRPSASARDSHVIRVVAVLLGLVPIGLVAWLTFGGASDDERSDARLLGVAVDAGSDMNGPSTSPAPASAVGMPSTRPDEATTDEAIADKAIADKAIADQAIADKAIAEDSADKDIAARTAKATTAAQRPVPPRPRPVVTTSSVKKRESPPAPTSRRSAEQTIEAAESAFEQGKLDDAEKLFLEGAKSASHQVWAYRGLGRVNYHRRHYQRAEYYFTLAIKLSPGFARDHLNRGLARWRLGRSRQSEACEDWHKAVSLQADDSPARGYVQQHCP